MNHGTGSGTVCCRVRPHPVALLGVLRGPLHAHVGPSVPVSRLLRGNGLTPSPTAARCRHREECCRFHVEIEQLVGRPFLDEQAEQYEILVGVSLGRCNTSSKERGENAKPPRGSRREKLLRSKCCFRFPTKYQHPTGKFYYVGLRAGIGRPSGVLPPHA